MRLTLVCGALFGLMNCASPKPTGYEGAWVLRWEDRNLMVLTLKAADAGFTGTLAAPALYEMSSEGVFSKIAGSIMEDRVGVVVQPEALLLTVNKQGDETEFLMKLSDPDHATLTFKDAPLWLAPLKFTRAEEGEQPKVAADWTVAYPPDIVAVQARLKEMIDEDQAIRLTAKISERAMEEMSAKHLPELRRIHEKYGWPKQSQFGREAAQSFFTVVQHQGPVLQRQWVGEMEKLVEQGEASMADFALLYDRVQFGLGRPQRWGNHIICVGGKAGMDKVEDPAGLAARREAARLPPIEDYLKMMEGSCAKMTP